LVESWPKRLVPDSRPLPTKAIDVQTHLVPYLLLVTTNGLRSLDPETSRADEHTTHER
jgi:hypothetical protein